MMTMEQSKYWPQFERFMYGVRLFQAVIVMLFLLVAPFATLTQKLYGATIILSALALFGDMMMLSLMFERLPERFGKRLIPIIVTGHALALILGFVGFLWPVSDQWQRVPGSDDWHNNTVASGDTAIWAQSNGNTLWRLDGTSATRHADAPSIVYVFGETQGKVWLTPPRANLVAFFDATKPDTTLQWHDRPPGYLSDALIDSNGNMWAIIKSKLWKMTDGHWHQALSTEASGVCSQNNRVVVVGKKVWQESLDGGKSWRDMTPKSPSISYPSCAIKETLWVFGDSGKFSSSTLWIKAKQNWIKRPLPVRDLRKFKVDSKIPGAAVLGAWGEGVWKTKDFGVTWEDLGLQGVEVRSIAFLPGIKNLTVASSNTFTKSGVYVFSQ